MKEKILKSMKIIRINLFEINIRKSELNYFKNIILWNKDRFEKIIYYIYRLNYFYIKHAIINRLSSFINKEYFIKFLLIYKN